jgi:glycosyltransferase involved in cell wall biosynthesis
MAPKFSVLVPAHNRADVVGYAIKSVLWQTEQDFEILVAGDGCTDNTAEIVAGFRDERVRWFDLPKAPHRGYASRNVALREARGQLIAFMAHDDLFLPDHLAVLKAYFDHEEVEWVYSRPVWVSADGIVLPLPVNLDHAEELQYFLKVANNIPASCVMHRRSCFDKYGYWPEDVPRQADRVLWRRFMEGGNYERYASCPTATCLHFKAAWRQGRTGSRIGDQICAFADRIGWWPAPLKVSIPRGVTEQQAFFETLEAGGSRLVEAMRSAMAEAIDRLALAAARELMPRMAELEAEMQQLTASRSWRLTAPLRALSRGYKSPSSL